MDGLMVRFHGPYHTLTLMWGREMVHDFRDDHHHVIDPELLVLMFTFAFIS